MSNHDPLPRTSEALQDWLIVNLSQHLSVEVDEIDVGEPFESLGCDSSTAVRLADELECVLGEKLSATLIYDFPSIESLATHLAATTPKAIIKPPQEQRASSAEPIAIIGLSCRFPGATSVQEYWQLLCEGRDAISEVPADRWPPPPLNGDHGDRLKWGGFLRDVDQFDPQFFGLSTREAMYIDPQQRLLLELTWEALEDAGQPPKQLAGSDVGVFVGISTNDYGLIRPGHPDQINPYSVTGNSLSIAANRISHVFHFQGPSLAIDTACSASLVAVHLACQSLWSGESAAAVAGGVNIILCPDIGVAFAKAGAVASDGRCKAFDARADGMVRSEGAGLVILKPLSAAINAGDPIYAVIRGSAANQDGRSNGLTAPNRQAQEAVLRSAYSNAGVSPNRVAYVETHGAGTLLGDPIEAEALGAVLTPGRAADSYCTLGSVKTNIGHTEAAAGIASLIKTALILKHRQIPPSLHFRTPNPHIPFEKLQLRIQQTLSPWPINAEPAFVGVSSFGFGGTNAHLVLEGNTAWRNQGDVATPPLNRPEAKNGHFLLPLSGPTAKSLKAQARRFRDWLQSEPEQTDAWWNDVCYSASLRRTHHKHRLSVVFRNRKQLLDRFDTFLRGQVASGIAVEHADSRSRKIAFVFSGQGSQAWGMGQQLFQNQPVFRKKVEECDQYLRPFTDWSLAEDFGREAQVQSADSITQHLDIAQMHLFVVQVALAALWESWGITPSAVTGHSAGEVAAAHVAGALSLADAVRVIFHRGKLMKQGLEEMPTGGGMALVKLSLREAQQILQDGYDDAIRVAAHNSPLAVVLSGQKDALQQLLAELRQRRVPSRFVDVPGAGHMASMQHLREHLRDELKDLKPQPTRLPLYSTVSGTVLTDQLCDAQYWEKNICDPVLFVEALDGLLAKKHNVFLEIGPSSDLAGSINQCCTQRQISGRALASLRPATDEMETLLTALATLHSLGYSPDWEQLYPKSICHVSLPTYCWQHQRCWVDYDNSPNRSSACQLGTHLGHPFLGTHSQPANAPGIHTWEQQLSLDDFRYLQDHRVNDAIVFPAAAVLEMALAAADIVINNECPTVADVQFSEALMLSPNEARTLQLVTTTQLDKPSTFQLFSRPNEETPTDSTWTLHASGTILSQTTNGKAAPHETPDAIQERCAQERMGVEYYQDLQFRRAHYGPAFQGLHKVWRRDGEALARLQFPAEITGEISLYQFHPAILDAALQTLAATLSQDEIGDTGQDLWLPVKCGRVQYHSRLSPKTELYAHAQCHDCHDDPDEFAGDIVLLDKSGLPLAEVVGLTLKRIKGRTETEEDLNKLFYRTKWVNRANGDSLDREDKQGHWLIFADQDGLGDQLASQLVATGDTCTLVFPAQDFGEIDLHRLQIHPNRQEDYCKLLDKLYKSPEKPLAGIVHLWSLTAGNASEVNLSRLKEAQQLGCGSVLHLVQVMKQKHREHWPHLCLVTNGTQVVCPEDNSVTVQGSPLWGLGRVLIAEHPEWPCQLVDLSCDDPSAELTALLRELRGGEAADMVALRGQTSYVPRLVNSSPDAVSKSLSFPRDVPSYLLDTRAPGTLEQLQLFASKRDVPGPGQVEIEIKAVGLNFRDTLKALGLYPQMPGQSHEFGDECAGTIVAVGEGVDGFQIGDDVIAVAPRSMGAFVITAADLTVPKPKSLTFAQAATIPVAFTTAWYSLKHLAHLSKNERVLIHSAAGGVGLAAIQVACYLGADVYATAGSDEKRAYLRKLGIRHVMDSRSLAFAQEILDTTNGEGVDVVLNSLSGEGVAAGMSTLKPCGRFIEIGCRNIYEQEPLDLLPFLKELMFQAVNMEQLFAKRTSTAAGMLREIFTLIQKDELKPLPVREFPICEAEEGFRFMAQAKHIGKIALTTENQEFKVHPREPETMAFPANASYVISGGLGDLGMATAEWLVDHGAKHLVLLGRSQPRPEAREVMTKLTEAGVHLEIFHGDVADHQCVADMFAQIRQTCLPIRGIVHAAGALADRLLLHLTQEEFDKVMAPKVQGAWNLHEASQDLPLDFFILFSSVASVLGSPGQANYSAANAFLDSLAHYRRSRSLPALSINWGPWAQIGGAVRLGQVERLSQRGIDSLMPAQALRAMELALSQSIAQVGIVSVRWRRFFEQYPAAAKAPLLAELVQNQIEDWDTPIGEFRQLLLNERPEKRKGQLEQYICRQLAKSMGSAPEDIDVQLPLAFLGIDSLIAIEMKNRIESELAVTLPVERLLEGTNIEQLADVLLESLDKADQSSTAFGPGLRTNGRSMESTVNPENAKHFLDNIDRLSEDEMDTLLQSLMAKKREET